MGGRSRTFGLGRLRRRNFRPWRLGDFMNSGGTHFESTLIPTKLFMVMAILRASTGAGSQISCTFVTRCWRQKKRNGKRELLQPCHPENWMSHAMTWKEIILLLLTGLSQCWSGANVNSNAKAWCHVATDLTNGQRDPEFPKNGNGNTTRTPIFNILSVVFYGFLVA